jgi:hypothetical protein
MPSPLGHDRHSFGSVLCVKEMPPGASSTLVWDWNLRPLIEARPISRHPSITGTRRACMSLVIEKTE